MKRLLTTLNLDAKISTLIDQNTGLSPQTKMEIYSSHFLGKPTLKFPLGEGKDGRFDKDPLYRFDGFDCTTLVETVLGLTHSESMEEFKRVILDIRYENGKVSYLNRNHFISADWIPNNEKNGLIRDITFDLFGDHSKVSHATISKKNWYAHKKAEDIQGQPWSIKLHHDLIHLGRDLEDERVGVPYAPLKIALDHMDLIPSGTIINIVRVGYDLKEFIGTELIVSHQGIAIRRNGALYYRHATTLEPYKVVDVLLKDYLTQYNNHPTIKGINILLPQ